MESGIDHPHPCVAVLPVIPQLRLPSEVCDLVYVVQFQLVYHVSVVDVQHDKGLDS